MSFRAVSSFTPISSSSTPSPSPSPLNPAGALTVPFPLTSPSLLLSHPPNRGVRVGSVHPFRSASMRRGPCIPYPTTSVRVKNGSIDVRLNFYSKSMSWNSFRPLVFSLAAFLHNRFLGILRFFTGLMCLRLVYSFEKPAGRGGILVEKVLRVPSPSPFFCLAPASSPPHLLPRPPASHSPPFPSLPPLPPRPAPPLPSPLSPSPAPSPPAPSPPKNPSSTKTSPVRP